MIARGGAPKQERPLADREVPLGHQETDARVLAPAVHAWLDGELPEASVRKGETARDVEFWKQINVEVETPTPHADAGRTSRRGSWKRCRKRPQW